MDEENRAHTDMPPPSQLSEYKFNILMNDNKTLSYEVAEPSKNN